MKKRWILALLCGLLFTVLGFALVGCDLFGGSGDSGNGGNQGGSSNKGDHVHNMTVHEDGIPATCTEDGTFEYYYCSDCGGRFADSQGYKELYDLTDHHKGHIMKYEWREKKDATCTQEGSVGSYYFCSRCKKNYYDEAGYDEIIDMVTPALGHIMEEHAAVEATCTSEGSIAYYVCKRCHNYYGDKNGTITVNKNKLTVSKEAHDMTEHIGTPATCLEDGKATYYACSKCKKDYIDEEGSEVITEYVLAATGHIYDEEWSYDETQHWHVPVCKHKDELENIDVAEHDMENYACKDCAHNLYTQGLNFKSVYGGYSLDSLGTATDEDIIVQPTYEGKPVVGVNATSFKYNTSVKSVVLLGEIKTIANNTFEGCTSLESVTLPESLTGIGSKAFKGCTALKELNIPDGVSGVSADSFEGCTAFIQNEGGISYADTWAIAHDRTVKDVILRADTKGVVRGLFQENKTLKSVVLPNGIKTLEAGMFNQCTSLTSVVLPENLTAIAEQAFQNCTSLIGIEIPDSVTEIGFGAFFYCSSLARIEISKNVVEIKYIAFSGCGGLQEITVEEGNPNYYSAGNCLIDRKNKSVIRACADSVIPDDGSVNTIDQDAFSGCRSLTSFTVPDCITTVGSSAFANCDLTSIVIPESVTILGGMVVNGCRAITIYCEAAEKPESWDEYWHSDYPVVWNCKGNAKDEDGFEYAIIDGVRYSLKDGIATVIVQPYSASGNIVIGDTLAYDGAQYSITGIVDRAFFDCKLLESVAIGDNVITIGEYAFAECSSLKSVVIGDSVTTIGEYAFGECTALGSVVIGDSVTTIGAHAFYNCTSLASAVLGDSVTSIGREAFYGCTALTSLTLGKNIQELGSFAFYNCKKLSEMHYNIIADLDFHESDYYVINNWYNVGMSGDGFVLTIGNEVPRIPDYLFGDSSNVKITEVVFEGNSICEEIGERAFYNCTNLGKIAFPESIKVIGKEAFSECRSLTEIRLSANVERIGKSAFVGYLTAFTVYCEAAEQPAGWHAEWYNFDETPVVWDCNHNDVDTNGYAYTVFKGVRYALKDGVATVAVQSYMLMKGVVEIPQSVTYKGKDYPVTNIKSFAFWNCTSLTGIVLPNGLTTIESGAFMSCTGLTNVVIPDSVTRIGQQAFDECDKVTEIVDGVVYVGEWAIGCTKGTTDIALREGTVGISDHAFSVNGSSIRTVNMPNSVLYLGSSAFYECVLLQSIKLSEKITEIFGFTFCNCRSLTRIAIPEGVVLIEGGVFYNCYSLRTVILPASLTEVDAGAFSGTSASNKLYFMGTQEELQTLLYSTNLYSHTWYCYSKTQPTEEGNYWHFDEDNVTVVEWPQA